MTKLILEFPLSSDPAAEFPGKAGVCGADGGSGIRFYRVCEWPEMRGGTVVCDGCKRGFHCECLRERQRREAVMGDWVCGECMLTGPLKKRWRLGPKVGLLDINEIPADDAELEIVGERRFQRLIEMVY